MGKSFGLQMAKASQEDIAGAFELAALLDAIDKGEYPSYFATPADRYAAEKAGIPTFFDYDDVDHLRHLHELLVDLLRRRRGFSLWRLTMGMDTILRNDILDPDADHLAIHPKFEAVARERQKLRDALAAMVGSSDVDHLRRMEACIVATAPDSTDKTASLTAIRALIDTAPEAESGTAVAEPVTQGESSVYGAREKEAVELASILDGLHEGGYDLETLYVTDPADGDCFVARAADLLREFATQPRTVPYGWVLVPIELPMLRVSEIKDVLSDEFGVHDCKARPLWAELLKIVAGVGIDDLLAAARQQGELQP